MSAVTPDQLAAVAAQSSAVYDAALEVSELLEALSGLEPMPPFVFTLFRGASRVTEAADRLQVELPRLKGVPS